MEQEHRISYKAGITRTPSDFLCGDGELAECINLATDNEELKPIVQPAEYITNYVGISGNHRPVLVYVHKVANRDNYIGYLPTNGNRLCSGTVSDRTYNNFAVYNNVVFEAGSRVTSIGKTLIIKNSNGMRFLKWNPKLNYYKDLGYKIPEPHLKFWMTGRPTHYIWPAADVNWYEEHFGFDGDVDYLSYNTVVNNASTVGIIIDREGSGAWIEKDADEKYNDLIVGLYAKNKKAICQKKAFCEPFFVRYALRLYDDSLYYISNPILMFPSVTRNTSFLYANGAERLMALTTFSYLNYEMDFDGSLEDFSDIVKDVDIFISNSINIYDTTVQQPIDNPSTTLGARLFDGIFRDSRSDPGLNSSIYMMIKDHNTVWHNSDGYIGGFRLDCLQRRDPDEIVEDIKSQSLFYKICSVGLKPASGNLSEKIDSHTLENLTTQEQLNEDDYYSRCKLHPENFFAYNSRLNLFNVARGFFEGYDVFMPFMIPGDHSSFDPSLRTANYDFYVTIRTEGGDVTVHHNKDVTDHIQGIYFYYPDSRAKHVIIMKGSTCVCNEDLKEHGGLNGAYFFKGLPGYEINTEPTTDTPSIPSYNNNATEQLANYIVTSEVNNPWVYMAAGYNKVGTGKIIGLSENTMALSQDAYGRNDLLIFSESGLWGMSVDRTGMFDSVHPYSREVCINEKSITKVDWGTLFISKKGLMLVTDQGVRCVSEQMNGQTFNTASLSPLATGTDWAGIVGTCQGSTTFLDYIRDSRCFLAYDYIDSRVLIINPAYGYQFVYSMVDGTISKTILPQTMTSTVNNYPDNLLQGSSYVYSFYHKPREEEVTDRQTAFLLTRPMKLAGPVSQASLRQLKNVGMWAGNSVVKTELYLSEDMQTWYNDISRHGAAARYYRIALYIKMLPTERLSGTILTAQDRRNNNIR